MQIQIQFISVDLENKGKYTQAEVAYKDLAQNKIASKKLFSFGNKDVYQTITGAKKGEIYNIEMQKNDKGYWDWIKAGTSNTVDTNTQDTTTAPQSKSFSTPKSTYETAEERAKKQVYIVRQSSITSAIALLKTDKKAPSVDEVIDVARAFEAFVFDTQPATPSLDKLPALPDDDDDIPM